MRAMFRAAVLAACTLAPAMAGGGGFGGALQAALPDTLGQVIGSRGAAPVDLAKLCAEGQPLPEPYLSVANKAAQTLMADYDHTDRSRPDRLRHQLRDSDEGGHWIGPQGQADLDTLTDPYLDDPTRTAFTLKTVVVAGDAESFRSIWEVSVQKPDGTAQKLEYGVDTLHSYWHGYKIWHIHVYADPDTAPVPVPYCRFDARNSY